MALPAWQPIYKFNHHQKPTGQFWPLILHQNSQPYAPTFLPASCFTPVAQNNSFCSWIRRRRGATVISQKAREQNNRRKHLLATQISAAGINAARIAHCLVCFWSLVMYSWKEMFLIFWFLILYSINPNHKLIYPLPFPFNFHATDPAHPRLWQPLKVCDELYCPDLPICVSFSCLQLNCLPNSLMSTHL